MKNPPLAILASGGFLNSKMPGLPFRGYAIAFDRPDSPPGVRTLQLDTLSLEEQLDESLVG